MAIREPARHERPLLDEAALVAARDADRILAAARERRLARWAEFFDGVPDRLREADLKELRALAIRARSAYGVKDSVREALPADLTEPFLVDIDRLLKALAREALERRLEA
jgi:hypothetical protein